MPTADPGVLAPRRHDSILFPRDSIWPGRQSRATVAGSDSRPWRRKAPSGDGASFIKLRCLVPSYRRPLARFGAPGATCFHRAELLAAPELRIWLAVHYGHDSTGGRIRYQPTSTSVAAWRGSNGYSSLRRGSSLAMHWAN